MHGSTTLMNKHYHFIGIGGIGMSGIASLLLRRGATVSGSDLKNSAITDELAAKGCKIFTGHAAENISGADIVVYSSAVRPENPEFAKARELGLPVIKRAEALATLMTDKTVITVAGSHGKTTTTSLASFLLLSAGLKPTAAIGGILRNIDTNAYYGDGEFFVAEADESDGSFLCYQPKYSIITNIDREHLDHYRDFEAEVDAFREFILRTAGDGLVLACSDDLRLKEVAAGSGRRCLFFGLNNGADIYPKNIRIEGLSSQFECYFRHKFISRFDLSLGGMHNVSNSLSVIALGLELGIPISVIKSALAGYKGAGRRMEIKYDRNGIMLIDDYAHHPTEIAATLSAIKNLRKERVVAAFQPHRYTRTKLLLQEFSRCFELADCLLVTDIYAASEPPIEGITGKLLAEKIKANFPDKEIRFLPKEEISLEMVRLARQGDVLVTLGAGDITRISDELAGILKQTEPDQ